MAYKCTCCGKKLIERFRLEDEGHMVYILYECRKHGFVDIDGKYYTRNADVRYGDNVDLFVKCDKCEKPKEAMSENKISTSKKNGIPFGILLTLFVIGIIIVICGLLKLIEFILRLA